jgi:hypothetical protein
MMQRFEKKHSIPFESQAKTSPKWESALGNNLPSIYAWHLSAVYVARCSSSSPQVFVWHDNVIGLGNAQ